MRALRYGLVGLLLALQWALWFGSAGVPDVWRLQQQVRVQKEDNVRLAERNGALAAEVVDLKNGLEAVEERARAELGMIRPGETFFRVVEDEERTP